MKVKELKITSGSASAEAQPRTRTVPRRPQFKPGDMTEDYYVSNYGYMFLSDIVTVLEGFGVVSGDAFLLKRFKEIEDYLYKFVDPPEPFGGNLGDSVVITFFE